MLILNPDERIGTEKALDHDFFWTDPMPSNLGDMLSQHKTSMFEFHAPRRNVGHAAGPHAAGPSGARPSAAQGNPNAQHLPHGHPGRAVPGVPSVPVPARAANAGDTSQFHDRVF
jgi:hypothetical protein